MKYAGWALVVACGFCWGAGHAVEWQAADVEPVDGAHGRLRFDIGPQPLSTAVRAFSDITGQALLVDERLLVGRVSPGARGEFTAEDALRRLLAGTGLRERYASDKAFTLMPSGEAGTGMTAVASAASADADSAMTTSYGAVLQAAVESALCRSERTRPGAYRLALQVWVAPSGELLRVRLLGSTGEIERDQAVEAVLGGLRVDAPPAGLAQPLTLLLLPADASRPARC
ncbi:STN domain-containing protein [Dyella sp. BiH032]|uniref:STN domain-containing protein n=1 Tax=Dyella sp. BiH032 TaxID=3075430 RepID=UPI00289340F8|nr:STN domain-containing protein [Dyella sp. BiH032]WNL44464.1 STN domain-containing protein [Dyella sp. BiH032]